MEDFSYHRSVLAEEAMGLLAPRPGTLVVDATCGGGGHTERILKAGADVVALDQDPDAIEYTREHLAHVGNLVLVNRILHQLILDLGQHLPPLCRIRN